MGRPALLVNAIELLRQPGSHRHLVQDVAPADVGVVDPSIVGDVHLDVELEAAIDDIIVAGHVDVSWRGVCRRCLTPLDETLRIDVHEHYTEAPTPEDDAFAIDRGQIDLGAMVREEVLLTVADERVCRVDCPGLCPTCGADLSADACQCVSDVVDDRWSALDKLRE